jgi:hypothetical protein
MKLRLLLTGFPASLIIAFFPKATSYSYLTLPRTFQNNTVGDQPVLDALIQGGLIYFKKHD